MNLQHLKYAVEVARTGSITEAAENLYITQPSLSKAIREMEAGLGVAVFERTPRGVIPTRKGRAFLEHARAILKRVADIESLAAADEKGAQAFSLSTTRASYVAEGLARFIGSLDPAKPLDVRVQEVASTQVVRDVCEGRSRLGVARCDVGDEARFCENLRKKGLKVEDLWSFDCVLLASAVSPLANGKRAARAALSELIEVVYRDSPEADPDEAEAGGAPERVLRVGERCGQLELLASFPMAYMWVSPMPPATLTRYNLAQRACEDGAPRRCDKMIYAADYRLSDLDRRFIDRLFEVKNEVAFATPID